MPGLNGLQTALMLHEILPATPIILFTVYKDVIQNSLAHNAGVSSVVSKTDQLTILGDEVQRLTGWEN
jgi:CheY-like chemotaxis protein